MHHHILRTSFIEALYSCNLGPVVQPPCWFLDFNSLKAISSYFSHLLKVNDYTTSLSKSKYALLCVEIDLAKPLKQGIWVGENDHHFFVVILYEKLPSFFYIYGLVGHGWNSCNYRSIAGQSFFHLHLSVMIFWINRGQLLWKLIPYHFPAWM